MNYRVLPDGTADNLIKNNRVRSQDVLKKVDVENMSGLRILAFGTLLAVVVFAFVLFPAASRADANVAPALISPMTPAPTKARSDYGVLPLPSETPQSSATPEPTIDYVMLAKVAAIKTESAATAQAIYATQTQEWNKAIARNQSGTATEQVRAEQNQMTAEAVGTVGAINLSAIQTAVRESAAATSTQQVVNAQNEQRKADADYWVAIVLAAFGAIALTVIAVGGFLISRQWYAKISDERAAIKAMRENTSAPDVSFVSSPPDAPQALVQVTERSGFGAMQYKEPVSEKEKELLIKLIKAGRNISINETTGMIPKNEGRFSRPHLENIIDRLTSPSMTGGHLWAERNPDGSIKCFTPEGEQFFGIPYPYSPPPAQMS